ncbi:hypothetical protein ACU4GD_24695 [Cupriavidus basilensis]
MNPVEAGIEVMAGLRKLEAEWNLPENRPCRLSRPRPPDQLQPWPDPGRRVEFVGALHLHAGDPHRLLLRP